MSITDKTRKVLWGRSGNRCAICRTELVVPRSLQDAESVVGEECHIRSGSLSGPRHDPDYPPESVDLVENLLLLCRVHHKQVDDQTAGFDVARLLALKTQHESWVSAALSPSGQAPRLQWISKNRSAKLPQIVSGEALLSVVGGAHFYQGSHPRSADSEEADIIGDFLQDCQDYGDLWNELEPRERVRSCFEMTGRIDSLEAKSFLVFGARETHQLVGGVMAPTPVDVAVITVVRVGDPSIVEDQYSTERDQ